jgi:hypothetical protein
MRAGALDAARLKCTFHDVSLLPYKERETPKKDSGFLWRRLPMSTGKKP